MVDFSPSWWVCNRCGKKNRIRKVFDSGDYLKTCSCGRTMIVSVKVEEFIRYESYIVGLRDCARRCDRGDVKKDG